MLDFKTLVAPYAAALPGRPYMEKMIEARAHRVIALRAQSPDVKYVNMRPLETEEKDGWVIRYLRVECEVGAAMDALELKTARGELTLEQRSAEFRPLLAKLRTEYAGVISRCEPLEEQMRAEGKDVWEACVMMEREGLEG